MEDLAFDATLPSMPCQIRRVESACYPAAVRAKWLLIIIGPALFMLLAGVAAVLVFPYPVPKRATPAQRLYFSNCATCHGASGAGSWRATLFLMHPSDLSNPRVVEGLTDEYLYLLIKNGGAPLGKPGMPAFGFHLRDDEIRELIGYLRALPKR
jgi:mono/diheme cytochrome c family protein